MIIVLFYCYLCYPDAVCLCVYDPVIYLYEYWSSFMDRPLTMIDHGFLLCHLYYYQYILKADFGSDVLKG